MALLPPGRKVGYQRLIFDTKLGVGWFKKRLRGGITDVKPVVCSEADQKTLDKSPSIHQIAMEIMKIDLASRSGWLSDDPVPSVTGYYNWAEKMWEESIKRVDALSR